MNKILRVTHWEKYVQELGCGSFSPALPTPRDSSIIGLGVGCGLVAPAHIPGGAPCSTLADPSPPQTHTQTTAFQAASPGSHLGNFAQPGFASFTDCFFSNHVCRKVLHSRKSAPKKHSRAEGAKTSWWLYGCDFTHTLPSWVLSILCFPLCPWWWNVPCYIWNLSSSAWAGLEGQRQRSEQGECHQFGPLGHRDLGVFKGCHRMNSFSGTTLPPWVSLPPYLYSRYLVCSSLGDLDSRPPPQTQPYEGHLGPWLPYLGLTCPSVRPTISIVPYNTHSVPSAWELNIHSSKLFPFKTVLFTHK